MKYSALNCFPKEPSAAWLSYISSNFIYEPNTGFVISKKTNEPIGTNCGKGYLKTCLGPNVSLGLKKTNFKVHILAWYLYYGVWPHNEIDHINNLPSDNRINNLRVVDREENLAKRLPNAIVEEPF